MAHDPNLPSIDEVMKCPATSNWLKESLAKALLRDPVDAYSDATLLFMLLDQHERTSMEKARAFARARAI